MVSLAAAQGMQVEASTQPYRDDDFNLFLLMVALVAAVVLCSLLLIGVVLGLLAVAASGILLLVGVVSVSTLVAIARRSVSAGVRTLLYQTFGLGGLLAGGAGGAIVHRVQSGLWGREWIGPVVVGAIVGAIVALGICWMFLTAIRMLIRVVRPEKTDEAAVRRV